MLLSLVLLVPLVTGSAVEPYGVVSGSGAGAPLGAPATPGHHPLANVNTLCSWVGW